MLIKRNMASDSKRSSCLKYEFVISLGGGTMTLDGAANPIPDTVYEPLTRFMMPFMPVKGDATADAVVDAFLTQMSDDLDHPEVWDEISKCLELGVDLGEAIEERLNGEQPRDNRLHLEVLAALVRGVKGEAANGLQRLEQFITSAGRSVLFQGALFYLNRLLDPHNPKYRLEGKVCPTPFQQIDVSSSECHLCCSGWLDTSIGDPRQLSWQELWNGEPAKAIRDSILDGSYRYCNKGICPVIQGNSIPLKETLRSSSDFWRTVLDDNACRVVQGPELVNLAYDRTCNLSCPSCRTEAFAATQSERREYERMQETTILPMLKTAKMVYITGSGDPFASKTFRHLMKQLTRVSYPKLSFYIMTNGMLLTPRQWSEFPTLHGRVETLRISIDAASALTHEKLRRGASWSTMIDNMKFAGELRSTAQVKKFELAFTVQVENYTEMGDAVDLAEMVGADLVTFSKLINWGTFSEDEYKSRAVFLPGHPLYADFAFKMQDERLKQSIVDFGNLQITPSLLDAAR
jgi:organic radical activating enzyme